MVKSKFTNLDTDSTLGGNNAQDDIIASQKAIKTYVDANAVPQTRKINGQELTDDITIDTLPAQTVADNNKSLVTNGSTASWQKRTLVTIRDWSV